ncbi:MAG: dTDP-glucose 4,6-dehydratase [Candidatus Omnitrophota bacterium]
MKILVTGGLGFIGSNFIRYVLGKYPNLSIVNLDKQTYAACPENLKDLKNSPRYIFVKGDICNLKAVEKSLQGCTAVVNFAAETHVDRSIDSAEEFLKTNVFGVHVLLEVAKSKKIKRFIQISTDEVYGSILKGSFTEEDPLMPNSPYSASKASADMLTRSYYQTFKTPVITIRPTNNFGPFQFPEKVIPLFVTNLLQNKKVPLYGDGKNVRDWLYVLDNCRAIDLILHKGKIGDTYNVGAGNEVQNLYLTELLLKIMGKPKSFIKPVKDRLGHDRRYSLDITKIRKLGFNPEYDFSEAILNTVNWYKENQTWWKKLKERS